MALGYKSSWKNKQYNGSEPKKYHIKTFTLCGCNTGYAYTCNILFYFGWDTSYDPTLDKDSGQAVKVVEYLLRGLGLGRHVFPDRYYTLMKLINYRQFKSTDYTGTVNTYRDGILTVARQKKVEGKTCESKSVASGDGSMLCCT